MTPNFYNQPFSTSSRLQASHNAILIKKNFIYAIWQYTTLECKDQQMGTGSHLRHTENLTKRFNRLNKQINKTTVYILIRLQTGTGENSRYLRYEY